MDRDDRAPAPSHDPVKHEGEADMPSTSDFVKKLYKMLEDTSWSHVVSWGPHGDCFVVKDMNEFTKSILPRMFKHSNFASFVRQLNKYDFHKVKNSDDNQFGEHSWTFRHPDFHVDRRDALENIKRKVPAARKSAAHTNSPTPPSASVEALQARLDQMARDQEELVAHVRNLESNYQSVLTEMVNFQRNMAQQDGLMQNLIQYFLQLENGKIKAEELSSAQNPPSAPGGGGPSAQAQTVQDVNHPFLPATETQRMMAGFPDGDIARASLAQMNEISRRAEVAGMSFAMPPPQSTSGSASGSGASGSSRGQQQPQQQQQQDATARIAAAVNGLGMGEGIVRPMSRQDALARIEELTRQRPASAQGQAALAQAQAAIAQAASQSGGGASSSSSGSQQQGSSSAAQGDASAFGGAEFSFNNGGLSLNYPQSVMTHEGLQVFTVGHLLPKSTLEDENGNWAFDAQALNSVDAQALNSVVMPTPQGMGCDPEQEDEGNTKAPYSIGAAASAIDSASAAAGAGPSTTQVSPSGRPGSAQTLRVRRSTYVPGWAVPPRVLLVDDDAVSRRLSSKFLQVFGCTIDVAVDGVGAVNKMNLEKYDLVLMDIVMPKLDGVSATSLIRQFDHMTPIISMTSNSKPNEIIKYYSSGMNDVLPKPFTRDGLLDMLEKHLMHLKVIQTMSKVPRSVGIPPLSDASFDQALQMQASAMQGAALALSGLAGGEDDGKINPLAGMGLTDDQYTMILQNLVNGESFTGVGSLDGSLDGMSGGVKRGLDDGSDGREPKRSRVEASRFEVVE
ncbi:HSF-type DNA-binding-domain-containing protein [Rhodofomes roseus]|uniref:Transcription factor n=1 Tax=Rhodofomes roseus TaxID=34475 RepID=A0ABQ8K6G1_9APHY|nr:HSF-type DNA-binding-domain-containing protein [Rhodofomes roseus]KAH9832842.1 HSF-type DNA-binding-domain-containing protein [Rhodofomes roseus]